VPTVRPESAQQSQTIGRKRRASPMDAWPFPGAQKGEHRGRSANPIIRVHDIAWLDI
jgi:hypothetical protein